MCVYLIIFRDPTPLTSELITEVWEPITPQVVDDKIILHNIPCIVLGKSMRNEEIPGQQFTFWDQIYERFYISSEE